MEERYRPGDKIRIRIHGEIIEGVVRSSANWGYPGDPDWYIEFDRTRGGRGLGPGNWKQKYDGGTMEKLSGAASSAPPPPKPKRPRRFTHKDSWEDDDSFDGLDGKVMTRPRRFFLFDNGGRTADRYSLIDMRPSVHHFPPRSPERRFNYMHFNNQPWHPSYGIAMGGEMSEADHERLRRSKPNPLGLLIFGSDLPPRVWLWLEKDLRASWDVTDEDVERLYSGV